MKNIDGTQWTLQKAQGKKGTLVIFSCNACPYAKAWEDRIVALGNSFSQKGIGVIQINANDPQRVSDDSFEKMVERAKAKGMKFPYVVDATSNVARAFGATRTPEIYLFDGSNKLVYTGAVDGNSEDASAVEAGEHFLKTALEAVLLSKPIAIKKTKAIGCGIKFRRKS